MASQTIVYVHGAGPQKDPAAFKKETDELLFGKSVDFSRAGHYAAVRWGQGGGGAGVTAAAPGRARRVAAIRGSTTPAVTPTAAADALIGATLTKRSNRAAGAAADKKPTRTEINQARRLVEQLYRHADEVAAASPVPKRPGAALNVTFPDPIFRFIVGKFASDVLDYLFGPWTEAMRAPVRAALLKKPTPSIVLAHSLGTIITYDVLSEPALAGLKLNLLVTVGCPLGIGNVQKRLRDGAGKPHPVPSEVVNGSWLNFADPFDPVALEQTLRDEFTPPPNFATDTQVNNQARNNHDLTGYLAIAVIRQTIADAASRP